MEITNKMQFGCPPKTIYSLRIDVHTNSLRTDDDLGASLTMSSIAETNDAGGCSSNNLIHKNKM